MKAKLQSRDGTAPRDVPKANAAIGKALAGKKAAKAARVGKGAKAKTAKPGNLAAVKVEDARKGANAAAAHKLAEQKRQLPHGAAIARLEAKAGIKAPKVVEAPKVEAQPQMPVVEKVPVAPEVAPVDNRPAIVDEPKPVNGHAKKNGGLAIVTHAGQIKQALKKVERAVEKNSTLPVLSHVLAETVGEDKVKFTATNMNLALWTMIDSHITTPGTICLPPLLEDLVAQMDDEHLVTLTTNAQGSHTTLRVGRRMTRLAVLPASEFPAVGGFNGNSEAVTLGMTHDQLKAVIKQLLPFVASDDSRPVLTGILMAGELPAESGQQAKIALAAADGFRLGHDVYTMPVSWKTRPKFDRLQVVVPGDAWVELAKFIGPDDGKHIQLAFHLRSVKDSDMEDGMLQVETPEGNGLRINLVEGNFPNFHEIMKEAPEYAIIPLPAKEVALASKGAALLAKKGVGLLRLICDVKDLQVRVEASDSEFGDFSESVPVEWREGHVPVEGFQAGYSVTKFAEMLKAADYDSDATVVDLRVSKNSAPAFVHVDGYTHVLMPMAIGDAPKDVAALAKPGNGEPKSGNGKNGHAEPEPPNVGTTKAEATKVEASTVAQPQVEAGSAVGLAMLEGTLAKFGGDLSMGFAQYAGDKNVGVRQALMKVLTGQEKPRSLCGVHALQAAYVNYRRAHPAPSKVEDARKGANGGTSPHGGKKGNGKGDEKVALVASYGSVSLGKVGEVKVSPAEKGGTSPHGGKIAKASGKAKRPVRKTSKAMQVRSKAPGRARR